MDVVKKALSGFSVVAVFAVVLAFAGSLGGCGNSGHDPVDLGPFVGQDDMTPKMCVASCTTNEQCQNSCPAPSTGISCCDTATNACFTASATSCAAPPSGDMATSSLY